MSFNVSTKKGRNSLSSNLDTHSQVINLIVKSIETGKPLWNGQTPVEALNDVAIGLWRLSQELKSA